MKEKYIKMFVDKYRQKLIKNRMECGIVDYIFEGKDEDILALPIVEELLPIIEEILEEQKRDIT